MTLTDTCLIPYGNTFDLFSILSCVDYCMNNIPSVTEEVCEVNKNLYKTNLVKMYMMVTTFICWKLMIIIPFYSAPKQFYRFKEHVVQSKTS